LRRGVVDDLAVDVENSRGGVDLERERLDAGDARRRGNHEPVLRLDLRQRELVLFGEKRLHPGARLPRELTLDGAQTDAQQLLRDVRTVDEYEVAAFEDEVVVIVVDLEVGHPRHYCAFTFDAATLPGT
jgi:hypothetical protein